MDDGLDRDTIAAAERVALVTYTDEERELILRALPGMLDSIRKRRSVRLPNGTGPAEVFRPLPDAVWGQTALQPAAAAPSAAAPAVPAGRAPAELPDRDADIAYAPVTSLASWIRAGLLSSVRLTSIYLERLERYGGDLRCVASVVDGGLEAAASADREIAAGRYRGPLHGMPWGAKDLLDTAGVPTTWGAAPYRGRVPAGDAAVVRLLRDAGAVLIAKLSLGSLAYGDVWYGGRTRNPWKPESGSAGSSAGSAAAVTAGLTGFAIGSETMGSIVSPAMRCGCVGLKPSFGLVPRTGAMALSWSYDKIGVLARTVGDARAVLQAIEGVDAGDPAGRARYPVRRIERYGDIRLGYDPAWFEAVRDEDRGRAELDAAALEALRASGIAVTQVSLPDLPYDSLETLQLVDAASAFEELTLTGRDDELTEQAHYSWPNLFRTARLLSAVEYVGLQRFRRLVMETVSALYGTVDCLVAPSFAGSLLAASNSTGHPSLTVRTGFTADGLPHGITLWGGMDREDVLALLGSELERAMGVAHTRPPGFS